MDSRRRRAGTPRGRVTITQVEPGQPGAHSRDQHPQEQPEPEQTLLERDQQIVLMGEPLLVQLEQQRFPYDEHVAQPVPEERGLHDLREHLGIFHEPDDVR